MKIRGGRDYVKIEEAQKMTNDKTVQLIFEYRSLT